MGITPQNVHNETLLIDNQLLLFTALGYFWTPAGSITVENSSRMCSLLVVLSNAPPGSKITHTWPFTGCLCNLLDNLKCIHLSKNKAIYIKDH